MREIKANKKLVLIIILITLIINISSVFAYSLIASDVSFTPKDSSWDVANTKSALDDLYVKANTNLLDKVYPIGSIYLSIENRNPSNFIGGEWEQVAQGRTLFGSGELNGLTYTAGENINAGLPNITGTHSTDRFHAWEISGTGAFSGSTETRTTIIDDGNDNRHSTFIASFDASRSNPIYGSSTTVQPNAYVVYMFKRIK